MLILLKIPAYARRKYLLCVKYLHTANICGLMLIQAG